MGLHYLSESQGVGRGPSLLQWGLKAKRTDSGVGKAAIRGAFTDIPWDRRTLKYI